MRDIKADLARKKAELEAQPATEENPPIRIFRGDPNQSDEPPKRWKKKDNHDLKKLPQSLDAEKALISCILLAPTRVLYKAERQVAPMHMHDPAMRTIYTVLKDMFSDGETIHLVSVTEELDRQGLLEQVGGAVAISELFTFVPTASNDDYYIDLIREKHGLRELIKLGEKIKEDGYSGEQDPKHAIDSAIEEAHRISLIIEHGHDDTEEFSLDDLSNFDPKNDPNSVLGYRWVCKGGSALWVGQAGLGKSSISVQAGVTWAQGGELFGLRPTGGRPLKSLYIQAENDEGDTAEMVQGVLRNCMPPEGQSRADFMAEMRKNLIFQRDAVNTGQDFARSARRLIMKHQPDLVWVDPLLSYAGDDISKQSVASHFLRNTLNPIAFDTGVVWMMMHHTGKPSNDPKARSNWTDHDFSYAAFGSSELVNWARAVNVLRSLGNNVYELRFSKRGKRAGVRECNHLDEIDQETGQPKLMPFTDVVYLQHAREGIYWEQIPKPEEAEQGKSRSTAGQYQPKHSASDVLDLLIACKGGRKTVEMQRVARDEANISKTTFYRFWDELKASARIVEKQGRWYPTEGAE